MFGPLNGVRAALVAAATIAALIALAAGFTLAGWVLLLGVAIHGFGWLFLYRQQSNQDLPPHQD